MSVFTHGPMPAAAAIAAAADRLRDDQVAAAREHLALGSTRRDKLVITAVAEWLDGFLPQLLGDALLMRCSALVGRLTPELACRHDLELDGFTGR